MERLRRRDRDDLPDDVLAEILRHVPPRWIAVSRCVSKALAPRHRRVPPPAHGPAPALPRRHLHAPGVNPATRCWDSLNPDLHLADPMGITHVFDRYLAFDPTVSPHYHVFNFPYLATRPYKLGDPGYRCPRDDVDPLVEKSEWPPSTCIMNVFSSRSGSWEETSFAREGDAAGGCC